MCPVSWANQGKSGSSAVARWCTAERSAVRQNFCCWTMSCAGQLSTFSLGFQMLQVVSTAVLSCVADQQELGVQLREASSLFRASQDKAQLMVRTRGCNRGYGGACLPRSVRKVQQPAQDVATGQDGVIKRLLYITTLQMTGCKCA